LLAAQADIVIENFRVGALDKFSLDYATVSESNPKVVYCSISGFGSEEGKDLPVYDLLIQAMGGLMSIIGTDAPSKVGVALVDVLTGLHASNSILAAIVERTHSGIGQHLEVNLLSVLLSSMVNQGSAYVLGGVTPQRMGSAHHSICPYEVFDCADRPQVIAVGNDTQFANLCSVLDIAELASDSRYSTNPNRVAHRTSLRSELNQVLGTATVDYWHTELGKQGVPCGPINSIPAAFELAEQLGLEPVHRGMVSNPVNFSRTPVDYRLVPPDLGNATSEVVTQFSLAD
jgi:crotonobetainyl-CoA:carnitine CoA-transferase CaiB-like acyl-CoA transferase